MTEREERALHRHTIAPNAKMGVCKYCNAGIEHHTGLQSKTVEHHTVLQAVRAKSTEQHQEKGNARVLSPSPTGSALRTCRAQKSLSKSDTRILGLFHRDFHQLHNHKSSCLN